MSYDIVLKNPDGTQHYLDERHHITGGTYAVGGTREAWLNVTYNYGKILRSVFGEKGIRTIYGMRAADSLPIINNAIMSLGDDGDPDYWKPTEGNVKAALISLRDLAKAVPPECIWDGD